MTGRSGKDSMIDKDNQVTKAGAVEIEDDALEQAAGGVENPTTIDAEATGGAGAGKIKFNEFTIKKTTDR